MTEPNWIEKNIIEPFEFDDGVLFILSGVVGALGTILGVIFTPYILSSNYILVAIYVSVAICLFIISGLFKYSDLSNRKICVAGSILWPLTLNILVIFWFLMSIYKSCILIFNLHQNISNLEMPKRKPKVIQQEKITLPKSGEYRDLPNTCETCGKFN